MNTDYDTAVTGVLTSIVRTAVPYLDWIDPDDEQHHCSCRRRRRRVAPPHPARRQHRPPLWRRTGLDIDYVRVWQAA